MKIMITGNLGYIGSVLGKFLSIQKFELIGLDSGFYKPCLVDFSNDIKTINKDIRDVNETDLLNVDIVVHLAGLSNDPLGEIDQSLTFKINYDATLKIAQIAKNIGVKKFIFISTQSIYGYSNSQLELDEDNSLKNPQTAYAESKWLAEQELMKLSSRNFKVIALRPATVFGWSPRLRTDIVFNNLVTSGFFSSSIDVHSDGQPWRPVIHVLDVCEAILKSLTSEIEGQSFNLGIIGGNYKVKELAEAASKALNNKPIIFNTENVSDSRSYRVNFNKAKDLLGFETKFDLEFGSKELITHLSKINLNRSDFFKKTNRLVTLKDLMLSKKIDYELRFNYF